MHPLYNELHNGMARLRPWPIRNNGLLSTFRSLYWRVSERLAQMTQLLALVAAVEMVGRLAGLLCSGLRMMTSYWIHAKKLSIQVCWNIALSSLARGEVTGNGQMKACKRQK